MQYHELFNQTSKWKVYNNDNKKKYHLSFEIKDNSQWNHKEQTVSDTHSTYPFLASVISSKYHFMCKMSLLRIEASNSLLFFSKSLNIIVFFPLLNHFPWLQTFLEETRSLKPYVFNWYMQEVTFVTGTSNIENQNSRLELFRMFKLFWGESASFFWSVGLTYFALFFCFVYLLRKIFVIVLLFRLEQ